MAQTNYTTIILYNSGTTTNAPSASNLASGELAINYTDGKLFYKDNSSAIQVIGWKTTPTTAGGTGLTSYTAGDLPYYASGSALSKLGIGTSGYVLQSNGSAPTWVAQSTLTVGNATNAVNVGTTDNTSSSSTYYPTLISATSGNNPITTSSTKLSFVPNTGILTSIGFAGSLNGTVGATSANTGAFTTITASNTITPSQTYGIVGTTTNNNANSGSFGEFVNSLVPTSSSISLTSGTAVNVTSISLTAGDWDVDGSVYFTGNGSTVSVTFIGGTNTTSATLGSSYTFSDVPSSILNISDLSFTVPTNRYSLSSTTSIYLVARASFSAGVANVSGQIRARRMR